MPHHRLLQRRWQCPQPVCSLGIYMARCKERLNVWSFTRLHTPSCSGSRPWPHGRHGCHGCHGRGRVHDSVLIAAALAVAALTARGAQCPFLTMPPPGTVSRQHAARLSLGRASLLQCCKVSWRNHAHLLDHGQLKWVHHALHHGHVKRYLARGQLSRIVAAIATCWPAPLLTVPIPFSQDSPVVAAAAAVPSASAARAAMPRFRCVVWNKWW